MDIQLAWQKLAEQKFSNKSLTKQDIMNAILYESNSTIGTIKRKLRLRIILLLSGIPLSTVILLVPNMLGLFIFSLVMQILTVIPMILLYRRMDSGLDVSSNVLGTMNKNLSLIKSAVNYERITALLIIPISLLVGWLVIQFGFGEWIVDVINKPDDKLMVYALIGIPVLYIYAEIYLRIFYGSRVKNLEQNIIKLKSLNGSS